MFLRLGCLSFGGPIAHLGYFHAEFVERRRWFSSESFAELVAIAQSLPGPASSQVAFAIGLLRAGWPGALAAWTGFTMPSALLLFAFACSRSLFTGALGASALHGLQLVAVAIVAQAVWTMQRALAPDLPRLALALAAAIAVFVVASPFTTVVALASAGLLGVVCGGAFGGRGDAPGRGGAVARDALSAADGFRVGRASGLAAAGTFLTLLLLLPWLAAASGSPALARFNAFYRAGALVFGGGHVVLPLLERAVVAPGWVDPQSFLAGYGMAQAIPGPLFTFAAYLGAVLKNPATNAVPGSLAARAANSALALAGIFLPGLLLMAAALPFWAALGRNRRLRDALRAINASVVGILFAALLRPVATTAFHGSDQGHWSVAFDAVLAAAAFFALVRLKAPPWAVVLTIVLVSVLRGGLASVSGGL